MTLIRHRTYSVVAGMLLVAFAIALFAAGHGKAATTPTPPPAPEVSVIYVQGEDVATYREWSSPRSSSLSSTRRRLESMKGRPMTNLHNSTVLDPSSSTDSAARAERELNTAIVSADISASYEEFLAIVDQFYSDDVEL